ncbi:hypothetical protein J2T02_004903 [Chitinophaga terrae (ex Kim and Jung 2007)]|uniref:RagB/SusD family nutrient uptake outer membrane protein n=1 Tax=Chitinophaga terrae (ex Kim and Jung 2007) TaxID=408074 RepID=UPI00278A2444|nr:RagB/SusD family nutrient uptake outer membrane protein [Chitinophaga terrae (ex Kim and Jung 2007)]MDQ0109758.1 hypothetical protein [Chitinophaga terrae (ex Kim and Jung 2007)]
MKCRYLPFWALLTGVLLSCEKKQFLDQTQTTDLTEEAVFSDSSRTVAFLNNIYTSIAISANPVRFGNGGLDASSDEAEPQKSANITTSVQFATGTVNAAIITDDAWRTAYSNIRSVNQLIKHIPRTPMQAADKIRLVAEARFLRAWYYAILLKHYGGVPLVGDTIFTMADKIPAQRSTFDECVKYIVAECDKAAKDLPVVRIRQDYGRVGAGACLALKARVLLYAASPLFNGGNIAAGNPYTGYTNEDPERWKLAADAARAVIGLNAYSLYVDNATAPGYGFYKVFTLRVNNEYIFARMQGGNRDLESYWQPPSRGGGQGGFPYQQLVDAFEMANGKAITDPASGYDPNNPYANRDPRMNYSIIHDQSMLIQKTGVKELVNIYLGPNGKGVSQDAVHAGTPTGYYINKMLADNISANNIHGTDRCLPLMRYAEVLLNFAEATNEYAGPVADVYTAVELIRQRAGLNPYQLPQGLDKNAMREVIRHERRVELAYEEHRFWDVRRWKIAAQTENQVMNGMEITRDGNKVTYKVFAVRKHNFREPMYLWPIPQSETAKSPELQQNPGY